MYDNLAKDRFLVFYYNFLYPALIYLVPPVALVALGAYFPTLFWVCLVTALLTLIIPAAFIMLWDDTPDKLLSTGCCLTLLPSWVASTAVYSSICSALYLTMLVVWLLANTILDLYANFALLKQGVVPLDALYALAANGLLVGFMSFIGVRWLALLLQGEDLSHKLHERKDPPQEENTSPA